MSHALAFVLVKPGTNDFEKAVTDLIADYDERTEVPEYARPCWCVGSAVQAEAREFAAARCGTIDDLRNSFVSPTPGDPFTDEAEAAWVKHLAGYEAAEQEFLASAPSERLKEPKADCLTCEGNGTFLSTYSPKARWDWWVIGGRWQSHLNIGYDPWNDPDNFEPCDMCAGTGKRHDALGLAARAADPAYTCNVCQGKRIKLKFNSGWVDKGGNTAPVAFVATTVEADVKLTPFAVVTPDGVWHERGKMGWFGYASDEKERPTWQHEAVKLMRDYPDHIAVVVDYHI